jgi:hypothetical protein
MSEHVLEHGTSRTGRWLRERRLRIAFWVAVVEGILVVVHAIPRWPALIVAAAGILVYFAWGRESDSDTVHQATWTLAASQALMILVPILVIVIGTFALIAVGILAVVALFLLFTERR